MTNVFARIPLDAVAMAAETRWLMTGQEADQREYDPPILYTDGQTEYAVSNGRWPQAAIDGVRDPQAVQDMIDEGRVPEGLDLSLVAAAQARTVLVDMIDEEWPEFGDDQIVLVCCTSPQAALARLGLSPVEVD